MNFGNLKSLNIGGVELKELSIAGVQAWKKLATLFNGTFPNKTVSGVTFSWDDANKILTMNGTATANIASLAAYSCSSISIPAGTYRWHCKVVGGTHTDNVTNTFFRFGNSKVGTTQYSIQIGQETSAKYYEEVTDFAPRINQGSWFDNFQVQFIVTEA